MFRFNRLVCLVLVCALAGLAYSKAVKSRELTAAGLGGELNPDVDGKIIMAFHDSATPATEVQLNVKGLAPDVTYGVQVDPGFSDPLAFTTNAQGIGTYHGIVGFPMDITAFAVVRIFLWDGIVSNIDEVTFQELRAYGCVSEECAVVTCETDADCDFNYDCLRDSCEGGLCFHERKDIDCDDGNACTFDLCIGVDESGATLCTNDQLPNCP